MQDDQPPGAHLDVGLGDDAGLDGIGEGGDALGCRNLVDLKLGTPPEDLDRVFDAIVERSAGHQG